MANTDEPLTFDSARRRELFLKLAGENGGITTAEVHARACELGDTATEEAYHNIARRLVHRAVLVAKSVSGERTRYAIGAHGGERWLEEDELARLVDPDYPVPAFAVWRESLQQVNEVPESVWQELRERLKGANAREVFVEAILSYCNEEFRTQIADIAQLTEGADESGVARMRKDAEDSRRLLLRLTKYGLGLSREAVNLPQSIDLAVHAFRAGSLGPLVNRGVLEREIARRVEDGPFVIPCDGAGAAPLLVGGVDGSSRGGLLSLAGQDGDFSVVHAPMISINTAVGQLNHHVEIHGRRQNVFVRLPEKPEDMQRQDNRHTVMAKLLYPDLTEAEYMHAVWNAMDLIEVRATVRLMRRWYATEARYEVPPVDVVFRDGTVTPQERDFSHYRDQNSYGQIARDLIEGEWDVALATLDEERVACGVVKQSQLGFYAPVLNWFACRVAIDPQSQLTAWPMQTMNLLPDQVLVTRLLTAGRRKDDEWLRTCIVLRPFHAVTNFAATYSVAEPPANAILRTHEQSLGGDNPLEQESGLFWTRFQGQNDRYIKMLRQVQYGSTFVAAVPRLDNNNLLPRFEILVPSATSEESESPWPLAQRLLQKVVTALAQTGFDVAAEHNMFSSEPKLDILPRMIIKAHDTVKIWAAELLGRVQEFVGYHLARYTKSKRVRGVQVRPFTRNELETLYEQLRMERERAAGGRHLRQ